MWRAAALLLAAACGAPAGPNPVLFHRLRVEYSTTSDWTTLDILNPGGVLTARLMSVEGAPRTYSAGASRMSLNQPLAAAQAGGRVGLTADLALSADAAGEPLWFVLKKGSVNGSAVRVSLLVGEDARTLAEIRHDGVVAGSGGTNPKEFGADLAPLSETPPREGRTGAAGGRKMVWAFYYPWYNLRDWSNPQLKDWPLVRYSSDDRAAIVRHIEQAKAAGIDGFVSSWWGPGHYTDRNLKLLLELAAERDFAVTVYFETLANGEGRGQEQITEWLSTLIATYREHPAFFKVDGKPLVVLWASNAVPLDVWRTVIARLREKELEAVYLGMSYDAAQLAVFDGLHQYSIFNMQDLFGSMASAGRSVRYYPLLSDSASRKIWAATVQPGYDERSISGRRGLFQDREGGAFYGKTWEAALGSDPDWVFITTWNEWWEHTHIEPSEAHGELYLDITGAYARWWKAQEQAATEARR